MIIRMFVSALYAALRVMLALVVARGRSRSAKNVELAVLRRQVTPAVGAGGSAGARGTGSVASG